MSEFTQIKKLEWGWAKGGWQKGILGSKKEKQRQEGVDCHKSSRVVIIYCQSSKEQC